MKTNMAVLHLKNKDPQKVYNLAGKVSTNMVANKLVFPNPDPTMEAFGVEITKLDACIKAKDGSKQKNQALADQAEVVHGMLKSEIIYVNKVAGGDKTIILLSGFDCNEDSTVKDIPGKVLIKRIEDGSVSCSAKIYIEALADADRYKIETATALTEVTDWKTVLDFGALNKLEIRNLIRGREIYIRVTGGNTHGWGMPSEPVVFIPR
jgi:hypothetical protein